MDDVPVDMTMLLRLLDSKMETQSAKFDVQSAKLDGIQTSMTTMAARFDAQDRRLDDHAGQLAYIGGVLKQRELQVREFEDLKVTVAAIDERVDDVEGWRAGLVARNGVAEVAWQNRFVLWAGAVSAVAVFVAAEIAKLL
jgi:hypothetical protein